MNTFKRSAVNLVAKNGVELVYKSVQRVINEVDSTVTKVVTDYEVVMYPKHINANQYNYPTLVGKDAVMFYLANPPNAFTVTLNDSIDYNGNTYKVQSWQSHVARGEICLYRIIAVKG